MDYGSWVVLKIVSVLAFATRILKARSSLEVQSEPDLAFRERFAMVVKCKFKVGVQTHGRPTAIPVACRQSLSGRFLQLTDSLLRHARHVPHVVRPAVSVIAHSDSGPPYSRLPQERAWICTRTRTTHTPLPLSPGSYSPVLNLRSSTCVYLETSGTTTRTHIRDLTTMDQHE